MSVEATSLVFACYPGGAQERILALALADSADRDGRNMFKSVATLATHSGQSERTVQRMLKRLVDSGWLLKCGDGLGGKGRSTIYAINEDWMALAHHEMGSARSDRRQPKRIQPPKGDSLSPFEQNQRVTNQTPKGDKFEPKGDKFEPKGDSHGCHPNIEHEHRTNNPLPPKGGAPVDNFESGENLQNQKTKRQQGDDLLAKLIATHPNHETSDTANASRALAHYATNALAPSAKTTSDTKRETGLGQADFEAMASELVAALQSDAQSERWRLEACRYAPKLSKWLRGKAAFNRLPEHVRPVQAAIKTEAQKSADMLAAMAAQRAKATLPPPEIAERMAALRGRRVIAA